MIYFYLKIKIIINYLVIYINKPLYKNSNVVYNQTAKLSIKYFIQLNLNLFYHYCFLKDFKY